VEEAISFGIRTFILFPKIPENLKVPSTFHALSSQLPVHHHFPANFALEWMRLLVNS
jgi:hypothetical protein